jgi:hypothetical protein
MGFGVANVHENRCLGRWTPQIPHVAAEAQQVERTKKDLVTGPIRGLCAPQANRSW